MALKLFKRKASEKKAEPSKLKIQKPLLLKNKPESFHRRYKAFCRRLLKGKIEIKGRNLIEEESSKGPIVIMSTHKQLMETLVYEALSPKSLNYISDFGLPISSKTHVRFGNLPIIGGLAKSFGMINVNRSHPTKGLKTAVSEGINILKQGGIICTFPRGHFGDPNKAIDREMGESTSRSSGIYIVQKAEQEMKRKIPIIFSKVEYDKKIRKYIVKMEKGYLPENADRKKLALEYIDRIESL